jgi:hypothetical protein
VTAIGRVTRVPARGSTTVVIVPPKACGLVGCVGEIEVTTKGAAAPIRVHLDDAQRAAVIAGLGGRPAYDPELADRLAHNEGR